MINVMTFNIRNGAAEDGVNHWSHRKPLVAALLRATRPDLAGLQECRDDEQAAYLRQALPEYAFLGVPRGGPSSTAAEMAPVLYARESFEVLWVRHRWLSETPDIPGSKSWDSDFPRTVTQVELLHKATSGRLVFMNTHFDYKPDTIVESASLLRRWVHELDPNNPTILCGDFNTNRGTTAYQCLVDGTTRNPLHDVYRQLHHAGDESTYHDYGRHTGCASIDWILVTRHLKAFDVVIHRTHQGELYPSDHFPVSATLK